MSSPRCRCPPRCRGGGARRGTAAGGVRPADPRAALPRVAGPPGRGAKGDVPVPRRRGHVYRSTAMQPLPNLAVGRRVGSGSLASEGSWRLTRLCGRAGERTRTFPSLRHQKAFFSFQRINKMSSPQLESVPVPPSAQAGKAGPASPRAVGVSAALGGAWGGARSAGPGPP